MNDTVFLNRGKVSYLDVVQVSADDRAVHDRNLHAPVESQTCHSGKTGCRSNTPQQHLDTLKTPSKSCRVGSRC